MRSRLFAPSLLLLAACAGKPTETKTVIAVKKEDAPTKPPEEYRVRLETTEGRILITVHRKWAPRAADHFYDLVTQRFYDGSRFHRVVFPFVAQWGVAARPEINAIWNTANIPDESSPAASKNKFGTVAFAKIGPESRATQVFINLKDNANLDKERFFPFGEVTEGLDAVKRFYSFYGEPPPKGKGPDSTRLQREGEAYLAASFPRLDKIERATIVP